MPWPRRSDPLADSVGGMLVAWSAVALAIALHRGEYLPGTLALALAGTGLAAVTLARPGGVGRWAGAAVALAVVLGGALAFGATGYSHGPFVWVSRACIVAAALATVVTAAPAAGLLAGLARHRRRWAGAALVLGVAAGVTRIVATPHPNIDVHRFMQASTIGLLHGRYLYTQCAPGPTGIQCGYPYLPWGSVLLLPSRLLTGDVRYGLVAALALAVLALWRTAGGWRRRDRLTLALPLLLLVFPQAPYSLLQDWTEPLLVAALVLMVAAVRSGRTGWATVAFAVGLATKQHMVLFVPLAAAWPEFGLRRTLRAAALGVLLVLPWLAADPARFWYETVTFNLDYRSLPQALDLPALLVRHGVRPGFALTLAAAGGAYLVALTRLPRSAAGFAAGAGLVDLAVDLTNKQSFFNHYTLGMAGLVLAAVCALADRGADQPGGWAGAAHGRAAAVLPAGSGG